MLVEKIVETHNCITLILSSKGATIANPMFGRCNHLFGISAQLFSCSLQTLYNFAAISAHNRGLITVAFIGTTPAIIFYHGNRRGKNPVDTSRGNLACGNSTNLFEQFRIIGRTQTNVMRKQCGTNNIVMPMYRICTPDKWDTRLSFY